MKVKRTACPCSVVSEAVTDERRREFGWRLVPASVDVESCVDKGAWSAMRARALAGADVFVWVCPDCAINRRELLKAS